MFPHLPFRFAQVPLLTSDHCSMFDPPQSLLCKSVPTLPIHMPPCTLPLKTLLNIPGLVNSSPSQPLPEHMQVNAVSSSPEDSPSIPVHRPTVLFVFNIVPPSASLDVPLIMPQRQFKPTPIDLGSFDVTPAPASLQFHLKSPHKSQVPNGCCIWSLDSLTWRKMLHWSTRFQQYSCRALSTCHLYRYHRVLPSLCPRIQSRHTYGSSFHTHCLVDPSHPCAQGLEQD